jgi:hypothetical protein
MAIFVPLFIYVKINKSLMMVGELSEKRKKIKPKMQPRSRLREQKPLSHIVMQVLLSGRKGAWQPH